jgi:tetratricopeptide (TPR) repeat protein
VVGEITEAGGRGQVVAYLYDAGGRLQTVARASAESEADTYRVVDEIARQLLAGRHQGPAEALTRLAAVTTPSVPALKAYLEGESRLREGLFGPAVEAFQAAIAADTAFALAHYRLAVAAEWDERSELSEHAAEQAARFGARLSGHHSLLVQGLLAWRRGDAASAELIYRQIVRDHREDVEAWFQLGEVLFHANPLRGRSIVEAGEPWELVRSREPGNRFAILHLARIAALRGDSVRLDALVEPALSLEPNGDRRVLELAGWRALVFRNRTEEDRVSAQLRRSGFPTVQNVAWQLVSWSRNLAGSERLARLMLDRDRHDVAGHLILAHLDLARGMRRRAVADLPTGEGADEPLMLATRAWFASLEFVPVSAPELQRLRRELTAWRPRAIPIGPEGPEAVSLHRAAAPLLRDYLLGTLSVRLGDLAGGARAAASLEGAPGATSADRLAQTLALGVRALIARSQGHPEAALQLLERIQQPARREEVSQSPFHAVALERYLRAELLRELGRHEEALGWYASLGELSPFELVFLAPSHLHQAEIHERLGRSTEAAEHYSQFVALWKDADPEFQPPVAEAGRRLRELRR